MSRVTVPLFFVAVLGMPMAAQEEPQICVTESSGADTVDVCTFRKDQLPIVVRVTNHADSIRVSNDDVKRIIADAAFDTWHRPVEWDSAWVWTRLDTTHLWVDVEWRSDNTLDYRIIYNSYQDDGSLRPICRHHTDDRQDVSSAVLGARLYRFAREIAECALKRDPNVGIDTRTRRPRGKSNLPNRGMKLACAAGAVFMSALGTVDDRALLAARG